MVINLAKGSATQLFESASAICAGLESLVLVTYLLFYSLSLVPIGLDTVMVGCL